MSTDGSHGEEDERAFLAAPQPPTTNHVDSSAPPSTVPPTANRVTRSQALARLRRGEAVVTAEAPAQSDTSSLEKAHDSAMDGVVETPVKKSSEDTSSHAAGRDGQLADHRTGTFNVSDIAALDSEQHSGAMRPLRAEVGADAEAFAGAGPPRHHRRRRHQRERAESEDDGEDDGARESGADSTDRSHSDESGGDGDGKARASPRGGRAEGLTLTLPTAAAAAAAARDPTRSHRVPLGPRLGAAALPRVLALQRTFETEARHIYEFCCTQVVEWPALAVEWIPDRAFSDPERDYTLQYIAIGSQVHPSSGMANTVKVMEVAVPVPATKDVMYGLYGDDDIRGAEAEDPELQEFVDPGKRFVNVKGHFHCEQTLVMDAPVLKIRAMPAETNILAVKTASGFVGVFNTVQEPQCDTAGRTVPDALLRGHSRGGFGLSWNEAKPGYIASASDDGYVNYYDVSHRLTIDAQGGAAGEAGPALSSGPETQPLERLVGHRDIVTDCCWHSTQGHLLASSSMDGDVRLWDIRMSAGSSTIHSAHPSGATAAQFHHVGAFQLATAGAEGGIRLWDIRHTGDPVAELHYHGKSVTGLQWSPANETVLASYGDDGRVVLWDLAKTSLPLTYSEDEVAPPEVSFVHIGHVGRVTDASWNASKSEDWLLASADTTNGLHVYRPLRKVVQDYRMFD